MARITIDDIDEDLNTRLRLRAAEQGRSAEEEARAILSEALVPRPAPNALATQIRDRLRETGGIDLDLPPRDPMRDPPGLD